ncbi:MAG: histidine kinase [Ilumatobacteraceae bacterium]|nr:histidine kinase [Ilumatobacteraceae bacterium]
MRRRITTAIVGVTALVLVMLGVPLAIVVQRLTINSQVVELQSTVAHLLTEINVPINAAELTHLATEPDAPPPYGVYDTSGHLVYGVGPTSADRAVGGAERGSTSSTTDGAIVVAAPLTDRDENVLAVVRISQSLAHVHTRAGRAWVIMAIAGVLALMVAWLLGSRVAGRLSRPVTDLAESASSLGAGGIIPMHRPSGVGEIDALGDALALSSQRINESIGRERRFSADVSHQLRTPLAGLRLRLERVTGNDSGLSVAGAALVDLDRLEDTVSHLLAFARDATPTSTSCQLDVVAREAARRWTDRCSAEGREIVVSADSSAVVRASTTAIEQILDVLIDNAVKYGKGTIRVTCRRTAGGAAIDVVDDGSTIAAGTDDDLFRRGHGSNNGIGLALARSIADAEGGRLIITSRQPTTFSLILLTDDFG